MYIHTYTYTFKKEKVNPLQYFLPRESRTRRACWWLLSMGLYRAGHTEET